MSLTIPRLNPGTVALVGAGPGDPGLLTVAGAALLAQATVVVYDALANPDLLAHAPDARHIYAGKRAEHHSMTQDEINALLVHEAKAGERVVRLKGGDPFVFGRGGEEAEALVKVDVPFVIVPGITAAVAAGAYAGIPVTHRDLNTSLTLVTGHEKDRANQTPEAAARPEAGSDATDWSALAKLPLLCFYMGVKSLPQIAEKLIGNGMDPDTPAASVQWGTMPRQKVVTATLATLADANRAAGLGSPAITYVGRVVALRDTLRWFDVRPLSGRRVLVTRTRHQASDLSAELAALGADVIEAPTLQLGPPTDTAAVRDSLEALDDGRYDWVVFTSANGVTATAEAMGTYGLDSRAFAGTKVAAVGPKTAEQIQTSLHLIPDLLPERFDADALADSFEHVAGKQMLLLRADIGRASLVDKLRDRGAIVTDVAVYETKPADALPPHVVDALTAGDIDVITFTSGSTVRNLIALAGDAEHVRRCKLVSIGPQTSAALRDAGLSVDAEATEATLPALADAVAEALSGK